MSISARLDERYRVRFDEAGVHGFLRSSGFLRWAQDVAWRHSDSAGFGRAWYAQHRLTWLIRAVELDIVEDVEHGSEVGVSTEVVGFRRVWARRRSEFELADTGRTCATALIDWVLLNEAGRPVRVPQPIEALFPTPPATFTPLRVDMPPSPSEAARRQFAVRASEIDPLGHVNNAAYLDYLDEHLLAAGRAADSRSLPRRFRAEFVQPAEPGMELVGHLWPEGDGPDWCYLLTAGGQRELFRARLEVDPAKWIGG